MDAQRQVKQILRDRGAVLVRSKKHEIWKFPDGTTTNLMKTPSDPRSWANKLSQLRNQLGIADPGRGAPGERRAKPKPAAESAPARPIRKDLNQLKLAGLVGASLAERTSALLDEIRRTKQ